MRASSILPALPALLAFAAAPALATPIELTFSGSLTFASEAFGRLDIEEGTPIKGTLLYESDTPLASADSIGSRYQAPFLDAWVRVGDDDYTLDYRPGCCDSIFVAPDFLSFSLALEDHPDWLRFESLDLRVSPAGPTPTLFGGRLPTHFSSKQLEPTGRIRNRIWGGASGREDLGTTRPSMNFVLDRVDIRPFEGDLDKIRDDRPRDPKTPPIPEPGTALLLGLGLAALPRRAGDRA